MDFPEAKKDFLNKLKSFKCGREKELFLQWIYKDFIENVYVNGKCCDTGNCCDKNIKKKSNAKAEILLACIKSELKKKVPFNAVMDSEVIIYPSVGEDAHLHNRNCVHVDAFLYDEDDVDDLIDQKKISTHHCLDCHSTNIESITYITHSTSKERLQYIFQRGLPSLKDKVILDVGSRLGVVLYAAHVYTEAKEIYGVEINKDLCKLQNDIITRFKLSDQIKIFEANILDRADIIKKADVITLHNVFEWFMSLKEQEIIWKFLYKNIKVGTLIVAATELEKTLSFLNTNINVAKWVKEYKSEDVLCIEESQLKIYEVINH